MRTLSLIGCLGVLTGLTGCPVKGTDEALEFKMAPTFHDVDYSILKDQVLGPFGCIHCHADMATEAGLQSYGVEPGSPETSTLYQKVSSGEMPKGGPRMSSGFVQIVATYIDGLQAAVKKPPGTSSPPPPKPLPPLPLAPTYASLRVNVLEVSCRGCHGMSGKPPGKRKDFSKYDVVKEEADEMYRRMKLPDNDDDVMPPSDSGRVRVPDDQARVFKEWIDKGFPEN
jgi:hypothetical protein